MWASVEKRMAMVENVRVALTLVARGEATLGIVYETDAKVEPGVKIVGALPAPTRIRRSSIRWPQPSSAKPEAPRYIDFLQSRHVEVGVREIWLQLPDQADVVERQWPADR